MAKKQKEKGVGAYDAALAYLTPKARTVREVEMKLDDGCYSEGEIMQTIERLTDAGLLDDEKYARAFVESRLNTKPVSSFRLSEQLKAHYVPSEIIDMVIGELGAEKEIENASAVAKKFMRQFSGIEDETERMRRVYTRLKTRGYDHETIMKALSEARE